MLIYILIPAIVLLIGLTLWLVAGIVITYRDPRNAAKIIESMGRYSPVRMVWRRSDH